MITASLAVNGDAIRRIVLEQSFKNEASHIGSNLCVADLLAGLYGGLLRGEGPDDPARDRFVLSKGHAAYALYAALHLRGWLSKVQLADACRNHGHPDHTIPGVEFSTGSLGQGGTYAVGQAMALKRKGSTAKVWCLLSDAECYEGSVWEAATTAVEQGLGNLGLIIDANGQQALGATRNTARVLEKKFSSFGFVTRFVNGHTLEQLTALQNIARPTCFVASTVFGKGVSFMERDLRWHYKSMTREDYGRALRDLHGWREAA